jgi:hypothetical protein
VPIITTGTIGCAVPRKFRGAESRPLSMALTVAFFWITALTASCGFSTHGTNTPPVVSVSISPSKVTLSSGTSQQFSASVTGSTNAAVTWSASGGTISGGGLFTAPFVSTSTTVTVTVASVANPSTQATATVTTNPPAPLSIVTSAIPNATTDKAYSASISASGGQPPYQWSLASGSLPAGIQLNSANGLLSGTTSAAGATSFAVEVTDDAGANSIQNFILRVSTEDTTVVPASFFGMHVAYSKTSLGNPAPWGTPILPPIVIGAMGKCVESFWPYIEREPGVYTWGAIDRCTNWAAHFGIRYVQSWQHMPPASIGATNPATDSRCWLSEVPGVYMCMGVMTAAGEKQWIAFNAAMARRYKGNPGMDFYEGWNEPPYSPKPGIISALTAAQLARYEKDRATAIRTNDPNAKVASPAFVINQQYPAYATFMDSFLGSNPPAYDYYDFHIDYLHAPEEEIPLIAQFRQILAKHGIVNPTIYATEAGKNFVNSCPAWSAVENDDMQQAFTARMELLYWSEGIARHYWYAYDLCGTLTNQPSSNTLAPAGIAYGNVENWIIGATMTQPCAGPTSGTGVWTCEFTKPDGTLTLAVWDSSQACSLGKCTTSAYSYDPLYTKYYTVAEGNNSTPLSGGTVQIGAKPILLSQ